VGLFQLRRREILLAQRSHGANHDGKSPSQSISDASIITNPNTRTTTYHPQAAQSRCCLPIMSIQKTPDHCTADFCLIPIGLPTASVSNEIAEVQRFLKKLQEEGRGVKFSMHSAGTTLGP